MPDDTGDDWVRDLLAADEVGPMPDDVRARLEAVVARAAAGAADTGSTSTASTTTGSEPTAATQPEVVRQVTPQVVPLGGRRDRRDEEVSERRHRAARRLLPVAAGVVVLGLAAVSVAQLRAGGEDEADTALAQTTSSDSAAGAQAAPVPRGLVATGTDYTSTDPVTFESQVRNLVAVATGAVPDEPQPLAEEGAEAVPEGDTQLDEQDAPDPLAARADLPDTPLADPASYSQCASDVTDGDVSDPVAIDLATVDGVQRAVVVVPDRSEEGYFVYVAGPDCDVSDLDFYAVTP